jgi:hypothetical protein
MGKDHIAIPKATLKRFADETERFSYIDVCNENGQIRSASPKTYFGSTCNNADTAGYYEESFDKEFVQKFERTLGIVAKWSESIGDVIDDKSEDECDWLRHDREWLKRFALNVVTLQTERRLADSVVSGNKPLRDFFFGRVTKGRLSETSDSLKAVIEEELGDSGAAIVRIAPKIRTTFLLTPFHYIQSGKCIFLTLAPRFAIALLPIKYFSSDNRQCEIWELSDEELIRDLIPASIIMAKHSELPHLIGERHTLSQVFDILQKE